MQSTLTASSLMCPPVSNSSGLHTGQAVSCLAAAGAAVVESAALLQGNKTVAIHHNGAVYRLQATRLGKLILTK